MLNLPLPDLETTYRSALESAALLRRCGETAKADRVESLARIVARRLAELDARTRHPEGARTAPPPSVHS